MKIVYFSLTGQTRRFAHKLDLEADLFEINPANPFYAFTEPFILIVPTYEPDITEVVNDFLDYQDNALHMRGVAGGGNRNFAELYIYTAKDIARDYHVPLVFDFEFNGTPTDVENFKKVVTDLDA